LQLWGQPSLDFSAGLGWGEERQVWRAEEGLGCAGLLEERGEPQSSLGWAFVHCIWI